MKSVDLAISTAVMAIKLHLVTDAAFFKKNSIFRCGISSTYSVNLKNIICGQMAMRSIDMSQRLGNTDQSQPIVQYTHRCLCGSTRGCVTFRVVCIYESV
jgi:hypothetical protein